MTSKIMRAALALAAGLGLTGLAAQAHAQSCDRACLIGVTDRYLAAVAAHDPSKAPLAPGVVFVENIKRMQPGEGLWKTASGGPTAFKVYVPDVALQQVGFIGVVQQDGKPMMLALRLKLENGRITQAEHILSAPLGGDKNPNIAAVRPALAREIPAGQRLPHDRLIAIGASYVSFPVAMVYLSHFWQGPAGRFVCSAFQLDDEAIASQFTRVVVIGVAR